MIHRLLLASFLTTTLFLTTPAPTRAAPVAFPLIASGDPVPWVLASDAPAPIRRAAELVARDVETVSGQLPPLHSTRPAEVTAPFVVIGTIGAGGLVDELVADNKLDAKELSGLWESFLIEGIEVAGQKILVVAGSDVRGTVYGVYALAEALGVSPWAWWADVPIPSNPAPAIPTARQKVGPPSVKYRGIFINDEDWALHPWAAQTWDRELGDIGPKTYEKVFELLLRLRLNTLWPAMHKVSRPFNADLANARLAAEFGVVMGSSHAEPMLRNNVREWTAPPETYNYLENRDGVLAYWEERVASNAPFESIHTLGMRGIHDSAMQGGATPREQADLLERIFADQRALLRRHVADDVTRLPQIFVPYKEVLALYDVGLEVPEDVTIVWPNDNFGYLRTFTPPEDRDRPGGFGVYYHISYLGRPMAYLWLNTTPPALLWSELSKSYVHGARDFWMLNVGDIKPAEIGIEAFAQIAWDIDRWNPQNLPQFLRDWAARTFSVSPDRAAEIAALMEHYYLLNFQRKPEHLQFHLPLHAPALSPSSEDEVAARLDAFRTLAASVRALRPHLPVATHDAFFQLVEYPVLASAAANERYFQTERFRRQPSTNAARAAWEAEETLVTLTRTYNEEIADGKWRHYMIREPADNDWRSMRIAPLELPPRPGTFDPADFPALGPAPLPPPPLATWRGGDFDTNSSGKIGEWTLIPGLGRSGHAVTLLPFDAPVWADHDDARMRPTLTYLGQAPSAGSRTLEVEFLPTFPIRQGGTLRVAVSVDDGPIHLLEIEREVGSPDWAEGVLSAHLTATVNLALPDGPFALHLHALDPGVVIDRLTLR